MPGLPPAAYQKVADSHAATQPQLTGLTPLPVLAGPVAALQTGATRYLGSRVGDVTWLRWNTKPKEAE